MNSEKIFINSARCLLSRKAALFKQAFRCYTSLLRLQIRESQIDCLSLSTHALLPTMAAVGTCFRRYGTVARSGQSVLGAEVQSGVCGEMGGAELHSAASMCLIPFRSGMKATSRIGRSAINSTGAEFLESGFGSPVRLVQ
jgi:hypothetical protein